MNCRQYPKSCRLLLANQRITPVLANAVKGGYTFLKHQALPWRPRYARPQRMFFCCYGLKMGINFDHTILVWDRLFFTLALPWVFCLTRNEVFFPSSPLANMQRKRKGKPFLVCLRSSHFNKSILREQNCERMRKTTSRGGGEASKGNSFSPPPPLLAQPLPTSSQFFAQLRSAPSLRRLFDVSARIDR